MIILDTHVLSELMRSAPDEHVLRWLDAQPALELTTTSVTAAELWYGVRRLPEGRRRNVISAGIDKLLYEMLDGLIEAFDTSAASRYADIVTMREQQGRPIEVPDAQIAAICLSRGATLVTRNVEDFEGTGVRIVNPWDRA